MMVGKTIILVFTVVLFNLVVACGSSKNSYGHSGSKQSHPPPGSASDVSRDRRKTVPSPNKNAAVSTGESQVVVTPWIQSFCRKAGCEFYSEIPSSFIKDPVTTATVCDSLDSPYVDAAIRLINGDTATNIPIESSHPSKREAHEINAVAEHLYDLLHGRYIITYEGLRSVRLKYEQGVYGQCPRVYCRGHPLLPVGLHDRTKQSTVKCFCPKCRDIYNPSSVRHRKIDGAAFGTTLPHLLLQRMPEICPVQPKDRYVPRIFGFELHESSTELQIYQGLTTNGDDNNDGDSANSGQKEEENKDLTRGMERLNEMEKEKEDEEEEEEEEEEETGDDKEEFEEMELSDLDEND